MQLLVSMLLLPPLRLLLLMSHDLAVVAALWVAYVAVGRAASTWASSTWAVAAPARAGTLPKVWHRV